MVVQVCLFACLAALPSGYCILPADITQESIHVGDTVKVISNRLRWIERWSDVM